MARPNLSDGPFLFELDVRLGSDQHSGN